MERETKGGQVSASEVESVQIKLRVKPALRAELEESAKENGVSLSQEIVNRLLRSFVADELLERQGERYKELEENMKYMREELQWIKEIIREERKKGEGLGDG